MLDFRIPENPRPDVYALRGELRDEQLANPKSTIRVGTGVIQPSRCGVAIHLKARGHIVRQSVEERTPNHLSRIVLVVDTSEAMREFEQDIQAALKIFAARLRR